jgi:RNA polymerase-binding transcription factor DksA
VEKYQTRLRALEQDLLRRLGREVEVSREPGEDTNDAIDQSVADELRAQYLARAESDSDMLGQVRAALARIADGTYGQCLVDGQPIGEARLEAVPWAAYCVKHQEDVETGREPRPLA